MGKGTLTLIRKALDEAGKEVNTKDPYHVEFIHAAGALLTHEYAKNYMKEQLKGVRA